MFQTMAEQAAYEAGQKLRKEYTLANEELDKAAEHYALEVQGEPAGHSSVRYDAYEQFFRCKDWFKAGYNGR